MLFNAVNHIINDWPVLSIILDDFTFFGLGDNLLSEGIIIGMIEIVIWTVLLFALSKTEKGLKIGLINLGILAIYLIPLILFILIEQNWGALSAILFIYLVTTIHTIVLILLTVKVLRKEKKSVFDSKTILKILGAIALVFALIFGYSYWGKYQRYQRIKRFEQISRNPDLDPKPTPYYQNYQITITIPNTEQSTTTAETTLKAITNQEISQNTK